MSLKMRLGRGWGRLGMTFNIKQVQLRDLLLEPTRNGLTKPKAIRGRGVPMIAMGEIFANNRIFSFPMERVPVTDKELSSSSIYEGDLLFARQSLVLEGAGKCCIVKEVNEPTVFESHLIRVRLDNSKALPDYIYYYFNSYQGKENIKTIVEQVAAAGIRGSDLVNLYIPIPPITVQQQILQVLMNIDDKIAINTTINENLEQQAQALFKAWFVDFEPFGGVMPDDWQIVPLGELCDSISKKHRFNKPELIFLNTGDVENGMVLHNNYSEVSQMPGQAKKSIAINDILYSEIRPINKHFTYVNFNADDYVVSTKLMVLRAKGISPRRLYQFLTMPDTLNELQHEAETRSGTFPQIRFDNIQQLEMIVASEQIENEYSERLNTIYSIIDSNNAENQRLAALRDTLLPKLMNGEIDVSAVKI